MANAAAELERMTDLPIYKRARCGLHFQDGKAVRAEFATAPMHYLDGKEWRAIDTALIRGADGFYGAPHSDIVIGLDGTVKTGAYSQKIALPSAPTGKLDGDRIVREFDGGVQFLWLTWSGFRQEIVLEKMPSLTVAGARTLLATEAGALPEQYKAAPIKMVDAKGNTYVYTTLADFRTWMGKAAYPVTIDPDIAPDAADATIYSSGNGAYADARNTSNNYDASGTSASLGQRYAASLYTTYRYFLKYDTSSIGAGSTVTQVNLKNPAALANDSSATDFDVQIVKQDWSGQDPVSAENREAAYDNCLSGTPDDNIFFNTSSRGNSGNLSTTWVSKTGATYYSLRSSRDYDGTEPTGNEYIQFYAGDYTANPTRRVYLTVAYSAAASLHTLALLGVGK